jgi:hypothetical protein
MSLLEEWISNCSQSTKSKHVIERAVEYIRAVLSLDQSRLKFVDEKSLKGAEIFNHKV